MSIANPVTNGTPAKAPKAPKAPKVNKAEPKETKETKSVKANGLSTEAKAASLGLKAFIQFVKADVKAEDKASKNVALTILHAEIGNASSVTGMTCAKVQDQVKKMRAAAAAADKKDSSFRTY